MNISRTTDSNSFCILTFDKPGSSANVFDVETLDELDAHIAWIESQRDLKGVVIASAKKKIFIAGADLNAFAKNPDESALGAIVDKGHRVFTRLERLQVPSAAAIHGVCLGGGCELALACDWRVASSDKATKIGLPETQLGILPAWGGSVRMPALLGLPKALELILTGKQLAGIPAQKLGLVDEVIHPEGIMAAATKLLGRGKRPPPDRKLMSRAPLSSVVAAKARKDVIAKTRGHYPAPLKAIEVCTGALGRSLEEGLALERAAFLELLKTPECANLMGIFFLQERAKKTKIPGADALAKPVKRVAVIGAGVMGAGIAQWVSARGIPVLLKDISPEMLKKGLAAAEKVYRDAAKRRIFTEAEAVAVLDRIIPAHTDVPMENIDLVVEAAVEKLDLKQKIFKQLETRVRPGAILATNTSALSIDAIAGCLADPGRVVGIHFFNPVHRMQLVEIVRGPRTSPVALGTALQFVKSLGKLPVVVNDSPGFLVNRILLPYMVEAVRVFREGCAVERVDNLMLDFGMPMGPLRLSDEVGLDVAQHVAKDLESRLPKPVPMNDTLEQMIAKGWLGKKSGRGFYVFSKGARDKVSEEIAFLQQQGAATSQTSATILDRLVLIMVNEAARCLEEGVVESPEDVDFGMIFGTGFAPFRGGPLRHADSMGTAEVVKRLKHLQNSVAPHFEPCARLVEMAQEGRTFYS